MAWARRAAEAVGAAMFAGVFALFCAKIVMRYAFQDELAWTDEVSIILFIWIVFWANSFILRERDHIRFDLVYTLAPPNGRRVMALLRALFIGGIFLYAAPASLDYIRFLWRERTPVLGLRLDLVYSCFVMFVAAVIVRSAWEFAVLLGPRWRSRI